MYYATFNLCAMLAPIALRTCKIMADGLEVATVPIHEKKPSTSTMYCRKGTD